VDYFIVLLNLRNLDLINIYFVCSTFVRYLSKDFNKDAVDYDNSCNDLSFKDKIVIIIIKVLVKNKEVVFY
jgi:hypothetical protein